MGGVTDPKSIRGILGVYVLLGFVLVFAAVAAYAGYNVHRIAPKVAALQNDLGTTSVAQVVEKYMDQSAQAQGAVITKQKILSVKQTNATTDVVIDQITVAGQPGTENIKVTLDKGVWTVTAAVLA